MLTFCYYQHHPTISWGSLSLSNWLSYLNVLYIFSLFQQCNAVFTFSCCQHCISEVDYIPICILCTPNITFLQEASALFVKQKKHLPKWILITLFKEYNNTYACISFVALLLCWLDCSRRNRHHDHGRRRRRV